MKSAQARYAELEQLRQPFLDRGRDCAKLTIPTLLPPDGHNATQKLPTPYQSVGARGVNHLSSYLVLTLFPPNAPFFKYSVDDATLESLGAQRGDAEEGLSSMVRTTMTEFETSALRTPIFEAFKLLLVAGNVLTFMPKDGTMKVYRLDKYVVKRDGSGHPMEIIVKDMVAPMSLSQEVRRGVSIDETSEKADKDVELYTVIKRTERNWRIHQEINQKVVPGSKGQYSFEKFPWRALRLIAIDGEDYGRSYVEEYLGDLISHEALTKAIVKFAAAASKIIFLVKPNATTKQKDLAKADSGDIKTGNAEDVSVLGLEKFNDFRVTKETADGIEKRLEFAFLMNKSIQRNGERVTAEEIRQMARDLEFALGGMYALLSTEFQLPLVNLLQDRLQSKGKLPKLPKEIARPMVVTGIEALGKGNDIANIQGALETLAVFPAILERVNQDELAKRVFAAYSVDTKNLLFTDEQMAQKQQQAMMQQMAMQAVPGVVQGGARLMQEGMKTQQAPQETPNAA